MTTCLGKGCSVGLPRVSFVNCYQFMYLVISRLVLRAGYGIRLYQLLIIAYLFTLHRRTYMDPKRKYVIRRPWNLSIAVSKHASPTMLISLN